MTPVSSLLSYESMLKEFHDKYGQYRREEEPGTIPIVISMLRVRLMNEEFGELVEALEASDRVAIADAIGDFAYVVLGTLVAYGLVHRETNSRTVQTHDVPSLLRYFVKEMGKLVAAIHEENVRQVDEHAHNMWFGLVSLAGALRMPFEAIFREVHASNMTKTPPEEGEKGKPGGKYQGKKQAKGKTFRPPDLRKVLGLPGNN